MDDDYNLLYWSSSSRFHRGHGAKGISLSLSTFHCVTTFYSLDHAYITYTHYYNRVKCTVCNKVYTFFVTLSLSSLSREIHVIPHFSLPLSLFLSALAHKLTRCVHAARSLADEFASSSHLLFFSGGGENKVRCDMHLWSHQWTPERRADRTGKSRQ